MGNMTINELKKLSIYELRMEARRVGVKSPTTKKHSELEDEILKIQNGEIESVTTKMGRPPKNTISTKPQDLIYETPLSDMGYEYLSNGFLCHSFADGEIIEGLNDNTFDCFGIVRKIEKNVMFFVDYLNKGDYVIISDNFLSEYNIEEGSFIIGRAVTIKGSCAKLIRVDDINFSRFSNINCSGYGSIKVVNCNSNQEAYNDFSKQSKSTYDNAIKIVIEAESLINISLTDNNINNCYPLCTNESSDIVISNNMLIDVLNLLTILSTINKPVFVCFIDIDYIYSILNIYYSAKRNMKNVDAGQYIKNILKVVSDSKNIDLCLIRKEQTNKNEYLDLILDKYELKH